MRTSSLLLTLAGLTGCWTQRAPSAPRAPASYQRLDLAVTGTGLALFGASAVLARGNPDELSMPLSATGLALAGLGGPILHLAHGRSDRALAGYLFRAFGTSAGMLAGYAATCTERDELLCGLEGMFWGMAGGVAVGALVDTIFLHGRDDESAAWTPTVSTGDGVTRIGVAGSF